MRPKLYSLARPMLIFYSLTFYGLNSSLSSNLNVVYTREEDVCCQHCALRRKKNRWTALQSLFPLVSDHQNQLSPKCPSLRTKPFFKCIGGLRFRLNITVVETTEQSKIVDYLTTSPESPSNKHCPTNQINMVKIQRLYQSGQLSKRSTMLYAYTVRSMLESCTR